MAVVVLNGKAVEVSDTLVDVAAFGLRSYLQGKYDGNTRAKIRHVQCLLRGRDWKPSELAALELVKQELTEAQ